VSWIAPRIASRTGAAHLRRGIPCQDCSGWVRIDGGSAGPAWAMAVADGHGSARHRRSRDGSRLACEVAIEQSAEWFAQRQGGAPERVGEAAWQELAERIVGRWQERAWRHWQENPDASADSSAAGERFTPLFYGTTLGLLLLTPRWWAHTGLGDWDLVGIDGDGQARLLSQERDLGAAGAGASEATASLCMADAALRFGERTKLHRLDPTDPPFFLLLSTDGIRKSCGSDADFLTLAGYLVEHGAETEVHASEQLLADLDRISGQGSGDDVTVAIARWGVGGLGEQRCAPPSERRILLCQPGWEGGERTDTLAQPGRFEPAPPRRRWGRMVWVVAFLLLLVISYAGSAWLVRRFPGGSGGGIERPSPFSRSQLQTHDAHG
jgi:hypothetical protein